MERALADPAFEALRADAPHPDHAEALMLFGQFVGAWDVEAALLADDGTWREHRGEWLFAWALEGRAIQDVLISPPRHDRAEHDQSFEYGTTIRIYEPDSGLWEIVYVTPVGREIHRLRGGREGDDIVLHGEGSDGRRQRWSFSRITPGSFLWQGRISDDDGRTWTKNEEMRARRR